MTTGTRFSDCRTDPGPLTGDDAVYAASIHHACTGLCWPKLRVLVAVDTEYGMHPGAPRSFSEDAEFAELLREAIRATQDASGHH